MEKHKGRNNWVNIGGDYGGDGNGRKYIPSPAKIRQWAKESSEGGRARCPICGESFSMKHMRLGTLGKRFEEPEWYCLDCIRETKEFRKAQ